MNARRCFVWFLVAIITFPLYSPSSPVFVSSLDANELPDIEKTSVIKADISEIILDSDIRNIESINTETLLPCRMFIALLFMPRFFLVEDNDLFYTVAYMDNRIIYIGLEHIWNPSANQRFKTPEGAYLDMNYKSFKKLRGRKKVMSEPLIGSYIQLRKR